MQTADTERADAELQNYLLRHPHDADALFLAAQANFRQGRDRDAISLIEKALDFAPGFVAARSLLAKLLVRLHRYAAARGEVEKLLVCEPRNPKFQQLKAAILGAIGDDAAAAELWRELAEQNPGHAKFWIGRGDALRALGEQAECLGAYRRAIGHRPSFGLAWWCLANMKTVRLDDADIAGMRAELAGSRADAEDRANLLFALGKAHEDRGDYVKAFEHYARGNAARRLCNDYDWDDIAREPAAQKVLFTPEFLKSRGGAGCPVRDPIFILGRPRSGSTLVEQILSSHSAVEGTAELPYVADLALELDERASGKDGNGYPEILACLEPAAFAAMGQSYMERTRIHRRLGRPHFIDKAPANYHHVGLIALMLPNAKIIDARRHPAACCFSMFKHNYTETNLRLGELGSVWRNYAELMAHFDRVLPGRIHRVIYENLVADPRAEIGRLLEYLALPFEENCLRFHETKRAVRSPSSEQVRRPISAEAVEHWRHFEPWLKPLLDSLGSVLSCYPCLPEDLL
ncbi:MAG: sulfotransferase [Rhizomicrobium sp.]